MQKLWDLVKDAFTAALQQYGPGVVLLLLTVLALFLLLRKSWSDRLKDKDLEIERMASHNKALEEIILKKRLSSGSRVEEPEKPAQKDQPRKRK